MYLCSSHRAFLYFLYFFVLFGTSWYFSVLFDTSWYFFVLFRTFLLRKYRSPLVPPCVYTARKKTSSLTSLFLTWVCPWIVSFIKISINRENRKILSCFLFYSLCSTYLSTMIIEQSKSRNTNIDTSPRVVCNSFFSLTPMITTEEREPSMHEWFNEN